MVRKGAWVAGVAVGEGEGKETGARFGWEWPLLGPPRQRFWVRHTQAQRLLAPMFVPSVIAGIRLGAVVVTRIRHWCHI